MKRYYIVKVNGNKLDIKKVVDKLKDVKDYLIKNNVKSKMLWENDDCVKDYFNVLFIFNCLGEGLNIKGDIIRVCSIGNSKLNVVEVKEKLKYDN